jgi:SAM-dependent methyltransferase
MNDYWDSRYQAEGKIWGDSPSHTAVYALGLFRKAKVKSILVPGSGYGRNTRLFSASGFAVTGVEKSPAAYAMALKFDPLSRFYNASSLDMSFLPDKYEAIYCFNVLHVFNKEDRERFIRQCLGKIKPPNLMFFTVFSEEDDSFGKGKETEKNTFESRPGRAAHYFTASDLKAHFKGMETLETGILEDPENHGAEGPHVHRLRYIYLKDNIHD